MQIVKSASYTLRRSTTTMLSKKLLPKFVLSLIVGVFIVGGVPQQASAESLGANLSLSFSSRGQTAPAPQVLYVYVKPGEQVRVAIETAESRGGAPTERSGTVQIFGPDGYASSVLTIDGTSAVGDTFALDGPVATTGGIWKVVMQSGYGATAGALLVSWDVGAYSSGVEQPGRVWAEIMKMSQALGASGEPSLYYLSQQGYVYHAMYRDYHGIESSMSSDAYGIRPSNSLCHSAYQSGGDRRYDQFRGAFSDTCGGRYKVFLNNPLDGGLPSSATDPDGRVHWLVDPIQDTILTNLSFSHGGATTMSGEFSLDVAHYAGNLLLQVDVGGNGSFDDAIDRDIQIVSNGGSTTVRFDGKDGNGDDIPLYTKLAFRVKADKKGEIHFIRSDVEDSGGGIEVTRLNGTSVQPKVLFWDDSHLQPNRCGVKDVDPLSNLTGVDSTGGVHSWSPTAECVTPSGLPSNGNTDPATYSYEEYVTAASWGEMREIDDWTYDMGSAVTSAVYTINEPNVSVTKKADKTSVTDGDVVTYTVTIGNDGFATVPTLIDYLPDGAEIVPGSLPDGCAIVGGKISCDDIGVLGTSGSITITYQVQVTDAALFVDSQTTARVIGVNDPHCDSEISSAAHCRAATTMALGSGNLAETGQGVGYVVAAAFALLATSVGIGLRALRAGR